MKIKYITLTSLLLAAVVLGVYVWHAQKNRRAIKNQPASITTVANVTAANTATTTTLTPTPKEDVPDLHVDWLPHAVLLSRAETDALLQKANPIAWQQQVSNDPDLVMSRKDCVALSNPEMCSMYLERLGLIRAPARWAGNSVYQFFYPSQMQEGSNDIYSNFTTVMFDPVENKFRKLYFLSLEYHTKDCRDSSDDGAYMSPDCIAHYFSELTAPLQITSSTWNGTFVFSSTPSSEWTAEEKATNRTAIAWWGGMFNALDPFHPDASTVDTSTKVVNTTENPIYFKNRKFFLALRPDTQVDYTFVPYWETSTSTILFKDDYSGQTSASDYVTAGGDGFSVAYGEGCYAGPDGSEVVDGLKNFASSTLVQTGTIYIKDGPHAKTTEPIYEPENKQTDYYYQFYNLLHTVGKSVNPSSVLPAEDKNDFKFFARSHPIFVWVDSFGYHHLFARQNFLQAIDDLHCGAHAFLY